MKTTLLNDRIAIFDEVLTPEEHRRVWLAMQRGLYTPVLTNPFFGGNMRPENGNPWIGAATLAPVVAREALVPGRSLAQIGDAYQHPLTHQMIRFHPSGSDTDLAVAALLRVAREQPKLIGQAGTDWIAALADTFVYLPGNGFGWHRDSGSYTGSFIYYAHSEWNAGWGGDLLVLDSTPELEEEFEKLQARGERFDSRPIGHLLLESGTGRFVAPRPNRLVLLARPCIHMVSQINPAAGDHVRATITGFFLRPGPGVERLLPPPPSP